MRCPGCQKPLPEGPGLPEFCAPECRRAFRAARNGQRRREKYRAQSGRGLWQWAAHGPHRAALAAERLGPRLCCACDGPLPPKARYVCRDAECRRLWLAATAADKAERKAG